MSVAATRYEKVIFACHWVLCFLCRKPIIKREATRGIFSFYGHDGRIVGTARTAAGGSAINCSPCAASGHHARGNESSSCATRHRSDHNSRNAATGHSRQYNRAANQRAAG